MATAASSRALLIFGVAALAGCASGAKKSPANANTAAVAAAEADIPAPHRDLQPAPLGQTASPSSVTTRLERVAAEGEINPCKPRPVKDFAKVDAVRRYLYETLCTSSLWADSLFGDRRNIDTARNANGRLEITYLDSQYEGTKFRVRGGVRVDLPNLNRRVHAFLGKEDQDEFIKDRMEGLAVRSQFIDIETSEGWLTGLGYGLPGSYKQRSDFRVGGKLGNQPEIFLQGRHRRNWILNRTNLARFRETIFWTNREGFGSTTGLDIDHIFNRTMLFRWANIGTISEETKGLEYRTALLLYQNLRGHRAIAYEAFLRGWTEAETDIREYGGRAVYRQSLARRDWLIGEVVLGYSWPRELAIEERKGSLTFGFGVELYFGPRHIR